MAHDILVRTQELADQGKTGPEIAQLLRQEFHTFTEVVNALSGAWFMFSVPDPQTNRTHFFISDHPVRGEARNHFDKSTLHRVDWTPFVPEIGTRYRMKLRQEWLFVNLQNKSDALLSEGGYLVTVVENPWGVEAKFLQVDNRPIGISLAYVEGWVTVRDSYQITFEKI